MRFPLRFLPEAKTEFDAAADWYEQQRVGLGLDFVARVREVLQRLTITPRLHATVYSDVRTAVVRRFPYVILYREDGREVPVRHLAENVSRRETLEILMFHAIEEFLAHRSVSRVSEDRVDQGVRVQKDAGSAGDVCKDHSSTALG